MLPITDSNSHQLPSARNHLQQLHEYASVKEPEKHSPQRRPPPHSQHLSEGLPPPLPHERQVQLRRRGRRSQMLPLPDSNSHQLPRARNHLQQLHEYASVKEPEKHSPQRRPPPYSEHIGEGLPPPLPHERPPPLPHERPHPLPHELPPPPYSQLFWEGLPPPLLHERQPPPYNPNSGKKQWIGDNMEQSIENFVDNMTQIINNRERLSHGRYIAVSQQEKWQAMQIEVDSFNQFLTNFTDIPGLTIKFINNFIEACWNHV